MARPACMSEDGNQAEFVGTFMSSGETVALCNECLPQFAAAIVASSIGAPVEQLAAVVADLERSAGAPVEAGDHLTDDDAPGAEHGAPTDEPPAPAPADSDDGDSDPEPSETGNDGRTHDGYPGPPTAIAEEVEESPPETVTSNGTARE